MAVSESDKPLLIQLLQDPNKKWFVAAYIQTVASFDKEFFSSLMKAAINTADPSYIDLFVEPCVRVFDGVLVIDTLNDYLNSENYLEIDNAVYFKHSKICNIVYFNKEAQNQDFKEVGFHYYWNELSKTYHIARNDSHRMTEEEYNDYLPTHTEFIAKRERLLKRIEGVRRNPR
ncbi:hypothetical protein EH230_04795 [Flavobacterium columnare]|uniref:Uncharacterized protein n=1 Tax=Flavobacterium columnare TaxID=996 RepID=A0A437U9L8_9FLAO|nr:hypothetical protein [Flavobacterium columnare]RVU90271.1 hypothetical protein EH230_04795 [Flavobacterium columnare]